MKHREITGSLMERGGKYTAIINLYDETGKRKQKSIALGIPVKGNKRKAMARLEELNSNTVTRLSGWPRPKRSRPCLRISCRTGGRPPPPPLSARLIGATKI